MLGILVDRRLSNGAFQKLATVSAPDSREVRGFGPGAELALPDTIGAYHTSLVVISHSAERWGTADPAIDTPLRPSDRSPASLGAI